ncbi:hypothetical protein L9F63_012942, partial [Diploptera punctata]
TPENWKMACEHVKQEEQFYWEEDCLMDEVVDRFEQETNRENKGCEEAAADSILDMEDIKPMSLIP